MTTNPPSGTEVSQRSLGVAISVVMPCLNEARTIGRCIAEAKAGLLAAGVSGEVIVADNGSEDGSADLAVSLGARVVHATERGYGAALRCGIEASVGEVVVIGDADESYDFGTIPAFLSKISQGNDLVMGNRFQGGIDAKAMPWTHRYLGNPVLSFIGRVFFRGSIGDFHCGLRAFTREAYDRMELSSQGMEFASEMVARSLLLGMKVAEIPVRLRRDGRDRPPHLRTLPDGWRHLRFMLLYSPRWLFLIPGALLMVLGAAMTIWLTPGGRRIGPIGFDINSLLIAGYLCLVGYQIVIFGLLAKTFIVREGLHPSSPGLDRLYRYIGLETGVLLGSLLTLGGLGVVIVAAIRWWASGFPTLDPRTSIRLLIPAVVVSSIGVETIFASFILSVMGMPRSKLDRRSPWRSTSAEPAATGQTGGPRARL